MSNTANLESVESTKTDLTKILGYREFFMKPLVNPEASEVDEVFGIKTPDSLDDVVAGTKEFSLVEMSLEHTLVCLILGAKDRIGDALLVVACDGDVDKAKSISEGRVSAQIQTIIHSEASYVALVVAGFNELRKQVTRDSKFECMIRELES